MCNNPHVCTNKVCKRILAAKRFAKFLVYKVSNPLGGAVAKGNQMAHRIRLYSALHGQFFEQSPSLLPIQVKWRF